LFARRTSMVLVLKSLTNSSIPCLAILYSTFCTRFQIYQQRGYHKEVKHRCQPNCYCDLSFIAAIWRSHFLRYLNSRKAIYSKFVISAQEALHRIATLPAVARNDEKQLRHNLLRGHDGKNSPTPEVFINQKCETATDTGSACGGTPACPP
jgi:hypothetical protein